MAADTARRDYAPADPPHTSPIANGSVSTPGYANLDSDPFTKVTASTASTPSVPSTPERGPVAVSDEEIEDYDTQRPDPDAMVSPPLPVNGSLNGSLDGAANHSRKTSIPIRIEKTSKKGRYMLHADDAEVSEILRAGMQKKAASAKRGAVRDLVFTRRFTTFDRQNPSSYDSPFHGFFTLFWIGMALLFVRVAGYNWKEYGSILGRNEVLSVMMSRDVLVMGITDGVMVGSTIFGLFLQKLCAAGHVDWGKSGWIIENVWQTLYLGAYIGWTFYREWPWTHTIFIVLHCLVFVMKQHSYGFYNGYLSQVQKRKTLLERKLKQLEAMEPFDASLARTNGNTEPTTTSAEKREAAAHSLKHRRKSSVNVDPAAINKKLPNLAHEPDEIAAIQHAITDKSSITAEQMDAYSDVIKEELEALSAELRGKCSVTDNYYPRNLTVWNWFEFSCLPTLVYELEYPRQAKTNWLYVAEKTAATFGTLMLMMVISQTYIYPPVVRAVQMKEDGMSVAERWAEFPWIVSDMLFPLLMEQLLTWYVIWECILNVLAEVWCFADRGFYGQWWNSVSWDQYARDWNRPVHNFLLRHVYHSSISAFHLSKGSATFVTFLLSALVHELIMFCLFKKVRGYLFTLQLSQLPLVMMSRLAFFKNKPTFGNVFFWFGLFVGPSVLVSLYLVI